MSGSTSIRVARPVGQNTIASASAHDMDRILAAIPHLYRGPGGSAAVLKDGELIAHRSFGYASLDHRAPMTPTTLLPICSISKQMVCLTMVSLCRNPTPAMLARKQDPEQQLDDELKTMLPNLVDSASGKLRLDHLYNMQSGIRDYWAMTTLFGARPDGLFSIALDAPQALQRTKSFHFTPGTEFSYSNVNFHLLGRILENVSGQSLGQLLSERVFIPAGMSSAALCPNTNGLPLPLVGYEGDEKLGYFAVTNRIEWAGDAGIVASLNDMIAYEKYIDRSWADPSSLYYQIAQQQSFKDGTPALYGYGLARDKVAGRDVTRHGGGLRGFRLNRMHIPSDRTSIVVMLNHEADAAAASDYILKQMVGHEDSQTASPSDIPTEWNGDFLEEGSLLNINVKASTDKPGHLCLRYEGFSEDHLKLKSDFNAESEHITATLDDDILRVEHGDDNRVERARRIAKPTDDELYHAKSSDYVGVYRCDEADSTFHCSGENGTLYGSFDGYLGKGPIWLMRYLGEDIWVLGNPRGMDAGPPGDWTMIFHRTKNGTVEKVTVGCWLARKLEFEKKL